MEVAAVVCWTLHRAVGSIHVAVAYHRHHHSCDHHYHHWREGQVEVGRRRKRRYQQRREAVGGGWVEVGGRGCLGYHGRTGGGDHLQWCSHYCYCGGEAVVVVCGDARMMMMSVVMRSGEMTI